MCQFIALNRSILYLSVLKAVRNVRLKGSVECTETDKHRFIKDTITTFKDFPQEGLLYRDVCDLFKNPTGFRELRQILTSNTRNLKPKIEYVVGLESFGFVLGSFVALDLELPFVPIRRKGKLPGLTECVDSAEGNVSYEIQAEIIPKSASVVIINDVLATGDLLSSACALIKKIDACVTQCLVIIEIPDLKGREKINAPVQALVQYSSTE